MKKALYLTAAVLAFAGCAKEPVTSPAESETAGTVVSFTASLDGLKTTFNKTDGYAWRENESVSVGTGNGEYVSFNCSDTENGVFTHTFAGTAPELLVAVSPAQSGTFTSAENYQVTLPSSYTFDRRTTNALLIGTPVESDGDNQRFEFKHAAALLRVTYQNVPVGTKGFWFGADTNITGTVSLTGTDVADVEIKNDNAGLTGTGVTINFAETTSEKDMTFYIPVPTGSYTKFQMNLWGDDSSIAESTKKEFSGTFDIARGEVKELPTVTLASNFTPYTVGATDCTNTWIDNVRSQKMEIPAGKVLHIEFVNHSSKAAIWNNWNLMVTDYGVENEETFVCRSDNWGWGNGDYNAANMSTWIDGQDWNDDVFKNIMDGAYVTITIDRSKNDNTVYVNAKSDNKSIGKIFKTYHQSVLDAKVIYAEIKCDNSYFEIKRVWYSKNKAIEEGFVGYRCAYDYYIYDTELDLSIVGTPKKINKFDSNGDIIEVDASEFTFAEGSVIQPVAGDQVFTATYKGETVNVTIPVKMGTEAFGSTNLVTSRLHYSDFYGDVPSGESVSKKMFVYSSCPNNWASPCADCGFVNFEPCYLFARLDNYTGGDYKPERLNNNWNWEKFKDYQNHNTVTITWIFVEDYKGSVRFDCRYWDGECHFQEYTNFYINNSLAYRCFTENSYVVVID